MSTKNINVCQNNNIIKIRVDRVQMRSFPFDIIYLVPFTLKRIIPNLFPYSLCMVSTSTFLAFITSFRINTLESLPCEGRKQIKNTSSATNGYIEYDPKLYNYFVIVPILPLTSKKEKVKLPSYFIAPKHVENEVNKGTSAFENIITENTILHTPAGPICPICIGCSRHLFHILGQCQLGSRHCFESLILERSPCEQLQADNNNTDRNP